MDVLAIEIGNLEPKDCVHLIPRAVAANPIDVPFEPFGDRGAAHQGIDLTTVRDEGYSKTPRWWR